MTVITLTTDFGLRSGFAGVMQGVIYGLAPQAKIVEITHFIPAQDILEGSYTLARVVPFFPSGTIHVYVVDPGVGTKRRPMAAQLGDHLFVGPDNGLLTPLIEDAEQNRQPVNFIHLDRPQFWRKRISHTFHGRDIFAPVAAHLANGTSLDEMGTPLSDPVRLKLMHPVKKDSGYIAHITSIDTFGNLTTDLPASAIPDETDVQFHLHGTNVIGLAESYGYKQDGELIALVDSEDYIEIAVVKGDAAHKLDAKVGDEVEVIFSVK